MRKLRLNLETLKVESFSVAEESAARGTVRANSPLTAYDFTCDRNSCSGVLCACDQQSWENASCIC